MLTEQQKNYLSMLLVGDALSQSEIRTFLSRSGWNSEQVDLGILLSEKIKTEATKTAGSTNLNTVSTPPEYSSQSDQIAVKDISIEAPHISKEASYTVDTKPEYSHDLGYVQNQEKTIASISNKSFNADIGIPAIQTMPENIGSGQAGGILRLIAWVLLVILMLMVIGLAGYMYYFKIGLFENITYTKVF